MAANKEEKELKKELKIALKEIGKIKPWFDEEINSWVYANRLYPVEYNGESPEEVIENYPKYLEVFIEHRMQGRIDAVNEKKPTGKGGYRPGAGRPKGTIKDETKQVRLPLDIALWIKENHNIDQVRKLMRKRM
jgi:hypothetical protein